jgi:hypothetical protein
MTGSIARDLHRAAGAGLPPRVQDAVLRAAARWLRRGARTARVHLDLADGAAWSVRAGRGGALVRCAAGSVWLTREGDPEDRVLGPGQELRSDRRGRIAALALGPARVVVELR